MKFRLRFVVPRSLSFENRFQNFNTIYCNTTILYGCVANSIPYAVSDNLNPFHFRNDSNKKTRTWHRKTRKPIIQTFVIVKMVVLRIAHSSLAKKQKKITQHRANQISIHLNIVWKFKTVQRNGLKNIRMNWKIERKCAVSMPIVKWIENILQHWAKQNFHNRWHVCVCFCSGLYGKIFSRNMWFHYRHKFFFKFQFNEMIEAHIQTNIMCSWYRYEMEIHRLPFKWVLKYVLVYGLASKE